MSISLRLASSDVVSEADRLCSVIERHYLVGGTITRTERLLEGFRFRPLAFARNVVYLVSGEYDWFLKIPRDGIAAPMERERLGAVSVGVALAGDSSYRAPAVTRVSISPAYLISSRIPGRTLNKLLFTKLWQPWPCAGSRLEQVFGTLGQLLARLHDWGRGQPSAPEATTRPFQVLDQMLARHYVADEVTNAIVTWRTRHTRADGLDTFVHGNFRLDNVVVDGSAVGFIDFENCGRGSVCQDLSRPVSELVVSQAAVVFPRRRVEACIAAFLDGYRSVCAFDEDALQQYVVARVARYYIESIARKSLQTIGGVPVSRSRLQDVTLAALAGRGDREVSRCPWLSS
jgi:hypothetical protein